MEGLLAKPPGPLVPSSALRSHREHSTPRFWGSVFSLALRQFGAPFPDPVLRIPASIERPSTSKLHALGRPLLRTRTYGLVPPAKKPGPGSKRN